jgi:hypothetical protein
VNRVRRTSAVVAVAVAGVFSIPALASGPASAASGPSTAQAQVVSAVPATGTPQISDGIVRAIAQVGSTMVAGGSFTSTQDYAKTVTYTRNRVMAFNATTGAISTSFAPNLNGEVDALLPGPIAGTVYVGGMFTTYNGAAVPGLVLLNVSDGSRVTAFNPGAMTKGVTTVLQLGSRLIIGGKFTSVGGVARGGLASLDPTTGALTSYLTTGVAGHHNFGHVTSAELNAPLPFPVPRVVAQGKTGVNRIAINGQGTRMVVVGNFYTVGSLVRDQIAVFNLTPSGATLDPSWNTTRYGDACFWFKDDAYLNDVDFAPDGNAFTVVADGGRDLLKPQNATLCDTASRWDANASGTDIQPIWSQSSGSDSFFAVADTGAAVYAVGHPRWANNPNGSDAQAGGAVARPSLMALDTVNGMPLKWNPGREPRGAGIMAVLATPAGLWLGYDNGYMGNKQYVRGRIAFMPLAGGYVPASAATPSLPAHIYLAGSAANPGSPLVARPFDGTTAGADASATSPIDWSTVRGAVLIGGTLFYGKSDNMLYSRTFDGTSYGPEQTVNPYSDPRWDNVVDKGRGITPITLKGVQPDFYGQLPTVTAMAFSSATHRLYYTLAGDDALYSRAFSPDSGVLHPIPTTVTGISMAQTTGLILDGSNLWFANGTTGTLSEVGLDANGYTGSPTVVSGPGIDGDNWAASTLFTAP